MPCTGCTVLMRLRLPLRLRLRRPNTAPPHLGAAPQPRGSVLMPRRHSRLLWEPACGGAALCDLGETRRRSTLAYSLRCCSRASRRRHECATAAHRARLRPLVTRIPKVVDGGCWHSRVGCAPALVGWLSCDVGCCGPSVASDNRRVSLRRCASLWRWRSASPALAVGRSPRCRAVRVCGAHSHVA